MHEVNETSTWLREYLFKSPEDYSKLVYLINSMEAVPNYARAEHAVENCGSDSVIRDGFPLEPLQQLISAHYMSMNDFCLEWYDNRDEVLKLHEAFTALNRTIYPIVAKSPVKFANYGGNVIPQIIGRQVFQEYYMPHYEEAAEIMHKNGKLIGSHFDSDNTPIMDLIADTPLDYIEAYDPGISPPLSEAFKAFGDKIIWINWSSAWHLSSPSQAVEYTRELIRQTQGNPRFLIGITEDIPADRFMPLLSYIMDGIEIES